MSVTGLGPHGERAATPGRVSLRPDDIEAARERRFSVAVVLHTTAGDWSAQQLAGITSTLGDCGTVVTEVVDCRFDAEMQVTALERLSQSTVDAVISIPVENTVVAEAHRAISRTGKCLVLNDNVPTGLIPPKDYRCLVSADNFGLGLIGAELLSPHVEADRKVGLLTYGVDFYATNEREIAFNRWMKTNRADLTIMTKRFGSLDDIESVTRDTIQGDPDVGGFFVVWDTPALEAVKVLHAENVEVPVTTVDLSREAAIELAAGRAIVGIAAQQPFQQGIAVASAVILSLLDRPVPSWVALPGLAVTRDNVVESYQKVWSSTAPPEILAARKR